MYQLFIDNVLKGHNSFEILKISIFFLHFLTAQKALFEEEEGKLYRPGIAD